MAAFGAKRQGGSVLLRARFLRTSGLIGEGMNEDSSGVGLNAWPSLKFSNRLGRGDSSERVEVRARRCLLAVADKIVRADINQDDFPPAPLPIRDLLRLQIKPFFVRVGWVVADHAPQDFVVCRSNTRKVGRRHVGFSDIESTREMIEVGSEDKRRKLNNAGGRELARHRRAAPPTAVSQTGDSGHAARGLVPPGLTFADIPKEGGLAVGCLLSPAK
jgi:hypothetical protein